MTSQMNFPLTFSEFFVLEIYDRVKKSPRIGNGMRFITVLLCFYIVFKNQNIFLLQFHYISAQYFINTQYFCIYPKCLGI